MQNYSKKERLGLIMLTVVCLGCIALGFWSRHSHHDISPATTPIENQIASRPSDAGNRETSDSTTRKKKSTTKKKNSKKKGTSKKAQTPKRRDILDENVPLSK